MKKPKILVILGTTSSGKSSLAVKIAKAFNGEIVSADSRQVYIGLDIGTGKITKKEMDGIPHYLLDVLNPNEEFDVTQFKKLAEEKIEEILKRNKLPIVVGGTGFYIKAIVDGPILPQVPPNEKLRAELEEKTSDELLKILEGLDLSRATSINRSNKRHLIRAIEIAESLGKVPILEKNPKYNVLQIGLKTDKEKLREKIKDRIDSWIEGGLTKEGEDLAKKISWKRFDELGLEYRILGQFLREEITKEEMIQKMNTETLKYAKRQKTWFKRDERIHWFNPGQKKDIKREISNFLNIQND